MSRTPGCASSTPWASPLLGATHDFATPLVNLLREQGGRPEATIIGGGARVPATSAALANGTLAHGLEYDDTNAATGIHPSCYVVPTALAAAERAGASGRAMLEAAIAGWEFAIRMGLAGQDYDGPFHSTSVTGTFASALIVSRLFGLSPDALADALGIAGSQAAGRPSRRRRGPVGSTAAGRGWPGCTRRSWPAAG